MDGSSVGFRVRNIGDGSEGIIVNKGRGGILVAYVKGERSGRVWLQRREEVEEIRLDREEN